MKRSSVLAVASIVACILCLVGFKLFVGDVYYVPGGSMESTISSGATVWVWKYQYGAVLPRTTSDLPYLSKLIKVFGEYPLWPESRLPGPDSVRRGDICLARFDYSQVLKRVVAVSGDTVKITNGQVTINFSPEVRKGAPRYVYVCGLADDAISQLKPLKAQLLGNGLFEVTVDGETVSRLLDADVNVTAKSFSQDTSQADGTFPKLLRGIWTRNDFGPFIVPRKGMVIALDSMTYRMYSESISKYEGVQLSETANGITVDGHLRHKYKFRYDYYFLLGDNRMESIDSRFLGVFPLKNVVGRINE